MSNVVVASQGRGIAVNQNEASISRQTVEVWKKTYCKGATDPELAMFVQTCMRTGLRPETRHIFAVSRFTKEGKVMTPQVSIDGLRLIAQRTGMYGGQIGPYWCGKDGVWTDIWLLEEPPVAAKVGVIRKDWKEPLWSVAKWSTYCQTDRDGRPTQFWKKMPELMLAKCCEALALRKAFPQELGGLYTVDEMGQATEAEYQEHIVTAPTQKTPEQKKAEFIARSLAAFEVHGITWEWIRTWLEEEQKVYKSIPEDLSKVEWQKLMDFLSYLESPPEQTAQKINELSARLFGMPDNDPTDEELAAQAKAANPEIF